MAMSASEFPIAQQGVGVTSQIDAVRAKEMVVRNSRFPIAVTMIGGGVALPMAVCMVLVAISQVFPTGDFTAEKGWSAFRWVLSAAVTGSMCPWLWQLGRAMAFYQVVLDRRGVDFHMGARTAPKELFMEWDRIASIVRTRLGNVQVFVVTGTDGSEAKFTSYSFFRPKKLARLIAERAGLTIQKG